MDLFAQVGRRGGRACMSGGGRGDHRRRAQVLGELSKLAGEPGAAPAGSAAVGRLPAGAPPAERLQWCRDALARLQADGFIHADRSVRDSAEQVGGCVCVSMRYFSAHVRP